jgi:hypothetical protein
MTEAARPAAVAEIAARLVKITGSRVGVIGSTVETARHEKVTQMCVTARDRVRRGAGGRFGRAVVSTWEMRTHCVFAVLLLSACSRAPAQGSAPSASASSAPAPKGTLAMGAPISAPTVALADIAKSPSTYANKTVTTTGKVTAVCQEMGCWMEIADASSQAHIRMHGHSFFVPKTASGHMARVQATVLTNADEECSDSPPPSGKVAKVELDATGVELD